MVWISHEHWQSVVSFNESDMIVVECLDGALFVESKSVLAASHVLADIFTGDQQCKELKVTCDGDVFNMFVQHSKHRKPVAHLPIETFKRAVEMAHKYEMLAFMIRLVGNNRKVKKVGERALSFDHGKMIFDSFQHYKHNVSGSYLDKWLKSKRRKNMISALEEEQNAVLLEEKTKLNLILKGEEEMLDKKEKDELEVVSDKFATLKQERDDKFKLIEIEEAKELKAVKAKFEKQKNKVNENREILDLLGRRIRNTKETTDSKRTELRKRSHQKWESEKTDLNQRFKKKLKMI